MIVVYVTHESSSSSSTVSAAQRWCTVIPLLLFATWKWHTRVSILDNRTEESFDGESLFFFFFFYFSFPIHSAEHSSITSDVVATSIRNIDKNSTSTQITRQFSNWSRANSFQREEHPWYVISRKRHYKSVAGSSSTTTWARNENWIRIHVSSISRGRSRDSTFEIESVKTWNCFADLARPVRRLVRAPSDHDRKTQRKRTLEKKRKETTLCFHAFERTIWNYVNIRCSQFDSCITGARVSPNIDNNNNNNNTTVSPYEERWSLRNRFSR